MTAGHLKRTKTSLQLPLPTGPRSLVIAAYRHQRAATSHAEAK